MGGRRRMSTFEAKREKAREAKESRMWADWVEATQKEISREAGTEREGGGVFVEGVWTPHPPVNLIPDNDWVGETWGVYFSDYDVDEIQERPEAYLKKYVPEYQPAALEAEILELAVPLFCPPVPRPRTPNPQPPPKEPAPPPRPPPREYTPPPPKVVRPLPQMRYKSPTPPPPGPVKMGRCTFCDFSGVQEDVIAHLKRSHKAFL